MDESEKNEDLFRPSAPEEDTDPSDNIDFATPDEHTKIIGEGFTESKEEEFLQEKWQSEEEEERYQSDFIEEEEGFDKKLKEDRKLGDQVKEEGKKFYNLLIHLMADPQKEIHSMYEQKPRIAFCVAIVVNILLISFYRGKLPNGNLFSELGIVTLTNLLIIAALYMYLKVRDPEIGWDGALAVLGIANFPLMPCALASALFALFNLGAIGQMFYTTGTGFSFLFVFLCLIEIFDFPVKRSIYAIPTIFVGSEFVIRAIAIF